MHGYALTESVTPQSGLSGGFFHFCPFIHACTSLTVPSRVSTLPCLSSFSVASDGCVGTWVSLLVLRDSSSQ